MGSIISYCHIKENKILKDGAMILEHPEIPLDDFMLEAFSTLIITYPKFYKMDRLSKLGFLASEILLQEESIKNNDGSVAVVLSNSNSSLDTDIRFWEGTKKQASPSLFVYTLPNIVIGEICIRHRLKGENIFFISPEFDSNLIFNYAELLINSGKADRCLAGWINVLGEQADVFLYLAERATGQQLDHNPKKILELYHSWNN